MEAKDFKETVWYIGWFVSALLAILLFFSLAALVGTTQRSGYLEGKVQALQETLGDKKND